MAMYGPKKARQERKKHWMYVAPLLESLPEGAICPDGIWQLKKEGDPIIGGQPHCMVYSRDIPEPNVEFAYKELYKEHSNEEGMYNCSLLPTNVPAQSKGIKSNVHFAQFHARPYQDGRVKPPAPVLPVDKRKMPARPKKQKAKRTPTREKEQNVASPPPRAYKSIKPKPLRQQQSG